MKKIFLILPLFALTACPSGAVQERVVEVSKPVAVYPVKAADVPAQPKPLPPRPSSLSAAADMLLGKVCEWVAYGLRTDPLLRVSSNQVPAEPAKYPECEK